MIVDGYKAFVNKSDVASVVKEYVAIIAVGISGVGNGKLCSQLNTAISFDEAMYLFEGMWLFLYLLKIDFLSSRRRLRAKYTHRTILRFVLCVFRHCRGLLRRKRRWVRIRMPMHPLTLCNRREMIRMPRNSFVQMNKLTNVSGRITYISSKAKQENLYATYTTVSEQSFWRELAKYNQESFRQSGTEGKCIEARELIIALPESFVYYEPEYLLRRFTDHFKQNYKVECISALHHNKRKTNYHIHLIFAERQLLDKPIEKIATRNMFYDEKGKHRRTKKEILDEAGNIRKKCKVIKKGEAYERNLFTTKNELFKADGFLDEVKRLYTDLINVCAINEEDKLQVFDRNGMYLATKKIGKNNPKGAEIEADNMERARWNQTVDRALISGVAEEDILGVKREKISEEVKHSIELYGNNPSFLGDIIRLAITDNDGDMAAINKKYANYIGAKRKEYIKICVDDVVDTGTLKIGKSDYNYNTLEPKLLKVNGLDKLNQIFGTDYTNEDDLRKFMKHNKTECALRIFESSEQIEIPEYILEAIRW